MPNPLYTSLLIATLCVSTSLPSMAMQKGSDPDGRSRSLVNRTCAPHRGMQLSLGQERRGSTGTSRTYPTQAPESSSSTFSRERQEEKANPSAYYTRRIAEGVERMLTAFGSSKATLDLAYIVRENGSSHHFGPLFDAAIRGMDDARRRGIKTLSLRFNRLNQLPSTVTAGFFPELRVLDISDNRLSTFPTPVLNMTHMKKLDISANGFDSLPARLASLQRLEELTAYRTSSMRLTHSGSGAFLAFCTGGLSLLGGAAGSVLENGFKGDYDRPSMALLLSLRDKGIRVYNEKLPVEKRD